ncbi:hypothetical protein [Rhodopirellula sp. P2]|uniref:hypothetical protein n=1 Tax=Rhodopirellula sp. P2 TaxID=2127060 RepID=UPI002368B2C0|nr:hypothetical protein [Rhodopirellula sp. P2]WDQ19522.1 hypothetical protein PSR62_22995 [Rhodopirellula sp. P2]
MHDAFFYHRGNQLAAVRSGKWKLHLRRTTDDQPFWSKKPDKTKGFVTLNEKRLINLDRDLGEKKNVADRHPEIVARLNEQAELIRTKLGDVQTIGTDQYPIR